MQLTIDTSWWTRYRSSDNNPDLDPNFMFPQAVPDLFKGPHTAIPRTNADLAPFRHIQAIANTAGFHMPTIEQGGTSLYPAMAQRASSVEVLRILISIGPTEAMHFQTWSDKAGNAPPLTDPTNGLTFPDLNKPPFGGETFQTNLIMPEPCPFLSRKLPKVSIIRPTETRGIATGVVKFLTAMGLFIGQSAQFFEMMRQLASEADAARDTRVPSVRFVGTIELAATWRKEHVFAHGIWRRPSCGCGSGGAHGDPSPRTPSRSPPPRLNSLWRRWASRMSGGDAAVGVGIGAGAGIGPGAGARVGVAPPLGMGLASPGLWLRSAIAGDGVAPGNDLSHNAAGNYLGYSYVNLCS